MSVKRGLVNTASLFDDVVQKEENVPLCAPGSTVYLTQAQQEYKLWERGPDSPGVQEAHRNGAKAKVTLIYP